MIVMTNKEKIARYPEIPWARVVDTIGVPHPYCITPKHLEYSDSMYLDVEGAEKRGARCGICKGELSYAEHETAVLVAVDQDGELSDLAEQDKDELQAYLKSLVPLCEEDGFAGFAFIKGEDYATSHEQTA